MALLDVRDLKIAFYDTTPPTEVVKGISFSLEEGETLGIVGESGSGKTQTALSILHLLKENSAVSGGEILYEDSSVAHASSQDLQRIRGKEISMIFQEPMNTLNPVTTVGTQLTEVFRSLKLKRKEEKRRAIEMLRLVGIASPESRLNDYPHQFSGGMRQRVMIAMALLCRPKLLIADEPTTALDVTVQAQIMTLLNELKREFNTAIIMITHDLGVVAGICDQVMVMYAGRTMEYGTAEQIFYHPTHPYSIGLMDAIPRLDGNEEHLVTIPGNPPNLLHLPKGCPFSPRCQFATEQCQTAPKLTAFNEGQLRNCWFPVEKFTL